MADAPQHQADERSNEGDQRGDVADLLERANWLRRTMKTSEDVGVMVNTWMARVGAAGIGDFAIEHPDHFEAAYDAAQTMLDEIPEDQLHQIDAGKPAK